MTQHPAELLPEYAAGILPEALELEVRAHLAGCPDCTEALRSLEDVFAQLPLALPAPPPPPELRGRLLASVASVASDAVPAGDRFDRFDRFLGRVAALLDVTASRARELVALIDDPAAWQRGPALTHVVHLQPGARVAHANCGFVSVRAGEAFPTHRHLGSEHVLVLQGGFTVEGGGTFHAGDEDIAPAGSAHAFTALPGAELIFLVVLENGIEMVDGGPADL